MKQVIIPSVIAQNQQELASLLKKLKGVSSRVHLDVVDGRFAPNHSLDFPFRLDKNFEYSMHLMVKNPQKWALQYQAHVDVFIPQFEEMHYPLHYLHWCQKQKKKIAFALKPETNIGVLKPYLQDIDYVLILTVHPGFYGRKFLPAPLHKIKPLKQMNPTLKIIVDGGINSQTIQQAATAGADYFISGSFVSQAEKPRKAYKELMRAVLKVR